MVNSDGSNGSGSGSINSSSSSSNGRSCYSYFYSISSSVIYSGVICSLWEKWTNGNKCETHSQENFPGTNKKDVFKKIKTSR